MLYLRANHLGYPGWPRASPCRGCRRPASACPLVRRRSCSASEATTATPSPTPSGARRAPRTLFRGLPRAESSFSRPSSAITATTTSCRTHRTEHRAAAARYEPAKYLDRHRADRPNALDARRPHLAPNLPREREREALGRAFSRYLLPINQAGSAHRRCPRWARVTTPTLPDRDDYILGSPSRWPRRLD